MAVCTSIRERRGSSPPCAVSRHTCGTPYGYERRCGRLIQATISGGEEPCIAGEPRVWTVAVLCSGATRQRFSVSEARGRQGVGGCHLRSCRLILPYNAGSTLRLQRWTTWRPRWTHGKLSFWNGKTPIDSYATISQKNTRPLFSGACLFARRFASRCGVLDLRVQLTSHQHTQPGQI